MRPIAVAPPGSAPTRVALTEIQLLRLENLSYRYNKALEPLNAELNALIFRTCTEAGFDPDPKTCKVDTQGHTVSGNPLPRAEPSEPELNAGSQKKKKKKP